MIFEKQQIMFLIINQAFKSTCLKNNPKHQPSNLVLVNLILHIELIVQLSFQFF